METIHGEIPFWLSVPRILVSFERSPSLKRDEGDREDRDNLLSIQPSQRKLLLFDGSYRFFIYLDAPPKANKFFGWSAQKGCEIMSLTPCTRFFGPGSTSRIASPARRSRLRVFADDRACRFPIALIARSLIRAALGSSSDPLLLRACIENRLSSHWRFRRLRAISVWADCIMLCSRLSFRPGTPFR